MRCIKGATKTTGIKETRDIKEISRGITEKETTEILGITGEEITETTGSTIIETIGSKEITEESNRGIVGKKATGNETITETKIEGVKKKENPIKIGTGKIKKIVMVKRKILEAGAEVEIKRKKKLNIDLYFVILIYHIVEKYVKKIQK